MHFRLALHRSASFLILALAAVACGPEISPADGGDPLPTCTDGVQNGRESDVDCGGGCGATCTTGQACVTEADCDTDFCDLRTGTCETEVVFRELTFTVVEGLTISEFAGWQDARTVLRSGAEFEALLGTPPPAELDFGTQWALFHSVGARAVPGHEVSVDRILAEVSGAELQLESTHLAPDATCSTYSYALPTWTLVRFDALTALTGPITETRSETSSSCTGGAAAEASCSLELPCGPDLLCAGLSFSNDGVCKPLDQWGVFEESQPTPIPDDGATVLTRTLTAQGLATVDIDVLATVELTHAEASELRITLTNPSGNELLLWDNESAPSSDLKIVRRPRGLSGDESVNGTWTLRIVDGVPSNAGQLTAWSVEIMSRYD